MDGVGTAVGIASLGIQICQGLLSYYKDFKDYSSDISSTYELIVDLSKTLTLLSNTLGTNLDQERVERVKTCLQGCENALLTLENERLNLQKHKFPEGKREKVRSVWQRSWYPFKKETIEKLKNNVLQVQERLQLALQVLQVDNDIALRELTIDLQEEVKAQSVSVMQHMSTQAQRIIDAQASRKYQKIVAWLSAADPWTNHDSARRRHEKFTGDWLLQSNRYQQWKLDTACVFFYFTFSDEHKQSDGDLLRSLVAQLAWREPCLSMLWQAYEKSDRSTPGLDEMQKILIACTESLDTVYLFLDAIEECPEEHYIRQDVLDQIQTLSSHASNLNIFATSRELPQIRQSIDAIGFESLRIATPAVNADIRAYVSTQLSSDRHFLKFRPEILDFIKYTISYKADGMFRWAFCQLQELKKLKSIAPKYVKLVLEALPTTLEDTYTQMLLGIGEMYHQQALTLLQWLAYSTSPPTLGELVEAAIIDPIEESSIDVENRGDIEDISNLLTGLITVQEIEALNQDGIASSAPRTSGVHEDDELLKSSMRVRLAHFSVKEYLESQRIRGGIARHFSLDKETGHRALAQSCLTYLRHYSASCEKTSTKQDLEIFPLLDYAARSWNHHSALQSGEVSREVSFLSLQGTRKDWFLVHDPDHRHSTPFIRRKGPGSSIYYASLLGLESVARSLIRGGTDINAPGGYYGNALQAATARGRVKLTKLLLDEGADINALGGFHGSALQAASNKNHVEMVRMLLDHGALVDVRGGGDGSPLCAASYRGHVEIVQLLLGRNADVNMQGGVFGNALQAASISGRFNVVQLLLNKGANVNAKGGHYGNAYWMRTPILTLKAANTAMPFKLHHSKEG